MHAAIDSPFVRIALLSPYSWTHPGGVTRHIDALARELRASGHEAHILAPYDPDDALSARLHRGARPQQIAEPDDFTGLGRTVGIPANGAVSNVALSPRAVLSARQQLTQGGYDVVHIHEPVAPVIGWDALLACGPLPLVGTFHTYSENALTNGIAAIALGGRRRMNRLHVRIAVSEAAAWTARRFYGGRYQVIPNGVHLPEIAAAPSRREERRGYEHARQPDPQRELRILFIGLAVERKGLPVLLRAFEALREHAPATLTLVGPCPEEVAHMMLDDHGVRALGKVSEQRKLEELGRADVLCAPSLGGESFGMVLTEAFASATPVLASDIPGYRDVVRDGVDGELVPAGDALALAESLMRLALDPARRERMASAARERAERFAWPHVAREVHDCYERAISVADPARRPAHSALLRGALRHGLLPADGLPRVPAQRLPARLGEPSRALIVARRLGRARETLPVVLGTMVSQTLLNLLALGILGGVTLSRISVLGGDHHALLLFALAPLAALAALLVAPVLIPPAAVSRSRRLHALLTALRRSLLRLRDGLRVFSRPRAAAAAPSAQLAAWALQCLSCWLLLVALGRNPEAGPGPGGGLLAQRPRRTALRGLEHGCRAPPSLASHGKRQQVHRQPPARRARVRRAAGPCGRREARGGAHQVPRPCRQAGPDRIGEA